MAGRASTHNVFDVVVDARPVNYLASSLLSLLFAEMTAVKLLKDLLPQPGWNHETTPVNDEVVVDGQVRGGC